jgi:hypothetical protein
MIDTPFGGQQAARDQRPRTTLGFSGSCVAASPARSLSGARRTGPKGTWAVPDNSAPMAPRTRDAVHSDQSALPTRRCRRGTATTAATVLWGSPQLRLDFRGGIVKIEEVMSEQRLRIIRMGAPTQLPSVRKSWLRVAQVDAVTVNAVIASGAGGAS